MCSLATGANGQVAVIDLHGQHVAEALKLLRRELTRLRSSAGGQNRQPAKSGNRRVQILVGTNHHSKVRHFHIHITPHHFRPTYLVPRTRKQDRVSDHSTVRFNLLLILTSILHAEVHWHA